jgi:hypothetical protein
LTKLLSRKLQSIKQRSCMLVENLLLLDPFCRNLFQVLDIVSCR